MDYLKIYRKGGIMTKSLKKETKKKGNKSISKDDNSIKNYEKYTCYVVGLVILLLMYAVIRNNIFMPALLITIGLEMFCISYYYLEDKTKKNIIYILFGIGVLLVVIAVIYTIVKTL